VQGLVYLQGLIPIFLGIYGLLIAQDAIPHKPKNPERMEQWRRKYGGIMSVLYSLMILFGIAQLWFVHSDATLSSVSGTYSWENPVTGISAKINSRWQFSAQQNADGQQIYIFAERANRAVVILGVDHVSGFTLDDYVQAFRKRGVSSMRFADGGRYFETISRKEAWQGLGTAVNNANNRLDVQVVKVDDAYWRVVTIQSTPDTYFDQFVIQLQDALWGTVR